MAGTAVSRELSFLAALAEVIGSLHIPGSLELISSLLDTLQKVMSNVSPDVADRRFVEQLLMSAIDNVVENFSVGSPTFPKNKHLKKSHSPRLQFRLVLFGLTHLSRYCGVRARIPQLVHTRY